MNYDNVFLPYPINLKHPLAQGLIGFWMALPGLDGGAYLYNLAQQPMSVNMPFLQGGITVYPFHKHGILKNISGSAANGPQWSRSPYGPSLTFDGVDDLVDVSGGLIRNNGFLSITPFTPLSDEEFSIVSFAKNSSQGFVRDDQTLFSCGDSYLYYFTSYNGLPHFYTNPNWVDGVGTGADVGTWNVYGASQSKTVYSQGTIRLYLNGKLNLTSTVGTASADTTKSYIGRRVDSLTARPSFNGDIVSTMIYNRSLSAAEMFDLNELMRNGYVGLLNRVAPSHLLISIPISAELTAVCTLSATLTLVNPDDDDIYSSENLRPMFDFLIPLVNQATGSNYTQCDVKFVFNNGRQTRYPDCD